MLAYLVRIVAFYGRILKSEGYHKPPPKMANNT